MRVNSWTRTVARCIDCNAPTDVEDPDEIAVCPPCVSLRRSDEAELHEGDGQAGARFVGQQREAALRLTFGELMAFRMQRRSK